MNLNKETFINTLLLLNIEPQTINELVNNNDSSYYEDIVIYLTDIAALRRTYPESTKNIPDFRYGFSFNRSEMGTERFFRNKKTTALFYKAIKKENIIKILSAARIDKSHINKYVNDLTFPFTDNMYDFIFSIFCSSSAQE